MRLFEPVTLGAVRLPSRIVMAPMTRNRAGPGNVPGPLTATYYAQRASAGLIVTESIQVSPEGQGYPTTPGLNDDAQQAGWAAVVEAVHAAGGRIAAQLVHAGRISHPVFQPDGGLPVAPSAIAPAGFAYGPDWRKIPFETPRALDAAGIAAVVDAYGAAAARARAAGFDAVEVHAGNGYLVDQFLRDGSNRRSDRWGGTAENRARILCDIAGAVVAGFGAADRVGVRFSPWNTYNDMTDSDPARTFPVAAGVLGGLGLAWVHVVEPAGTAEPIARAMAAAAGAPLILNGGYLAEAAEAAIRGGAADAVSFGKPFIANPDLPARFRAGLPLAEADRATIYGGGAKGYTDYPPAGG